MIKIQFILQIIFYLFFINIGFTQQKNDLNILNLNGKIKSITELYIEAKDSNNTYINEFKLTKCITSFNKNGFLTSEKYYEGKNKLRDQYTYIYSDDELLIERKRKNKEENRKSWVKVSFTFFGFLNADLSRLSSIEKKIYYDYDSAGNKTHEFYMLSKNRLIQEYVYNYDSKNQLIEKKYIDYRNKYTVKTINVYDSVTNSLETKAYRNEKYIGKDIQLFDSIGNLTEKTGFGSDGKMEEKFRYKYDSKNNCIESILWDKKGKIVFHKKFTYEYDENDNWIKRIEIENKKERETTIRKILYY